MGTISESEWEALLVTISIAALSKDEKRRMVMEMAAKYGREVRPEDLVKAGAV
ncbi:MAG: hypothetical protein QXM43_02840 [Desulfurococcaceae archaeon]